MKVRYTKTKEEEMIESKAHSLVLNQCSRQSFPLIQAITLPLIYQVLPRFFLSLPIWVKETEDFV